MTTGTGSDIGTTEGVAICIKPYKIGKIIDFAEGQAIRYKKHEREVHRWSEPTYEVFIPKSISYANHLCTIGETMFNLHFRRFT